MGGDARQARRAGHPPKGTRYHGQHRGGKEGSQLHHAHHVEGSGSDGRQGFGGKKDYENPEFRMMMASSAGSPLRNMQICGGMKDGLMQALLEIANGHFLRGVGRMLRG